MKLIAIVALTLVVLTVRGQVSHQVESESLRGSEIYQDQTEDEQFLAEVDVGEIHQAKLEDPNLK